jgi:hypothetical protein
MATRVTAATIANAGTSLTNWELNVGASMALASMTLPDGTTGSQVQGISASGGNLRINYNGAVALTGTKTIEFELNVQGPVGDNTEIALNLLLGNDSVVGNAYQLVGGLTLSCNRGWQKFRFCLDDFAVSSGAPTWTTFNQIRWNFTLIASTVLTVGFRNLGFGGWDQPFGAIMFDDQGDTVYDVAYPLMAARGIPGSIAVIGAYVDETGLNDAAHGGFGRCTTTELRTLRDAGWSMVNHTQTHQQGVLNIGTQAVCATEIANGRNALTSNGLARGGSENIFCAPYGEWSDNYLAAALAEGVTFYRGTTSDGTSTTDPPHCPGFISSALRPYQCLVVSNATTTTQINAHITKCASAGRCCIILFHHIITPADTTIKFTPANFTIVIGHAYAKSGLIKWVNMVDFVNNLKNPTT